MPEYNYIYTPLTIALALVGMWYQFKNQSPEDKDHAIYAITNDNSINIYIPPATK